MDRSVPAWRQALSRDDIDALLEMRDWKSWRSIAVNWALVAASFWLQHSRSTASQAVRA